MGARDGWEMIGMTSRLECPYCGVDDSLPLVTREDGATMHEECCREWQQGMARAAGHRDNTRQQREQARAALARSIERYGDQR